MTPIYQNLDGRVTIYHCDMRDLIPHLISIGEPIHLIATDPAYKTISGGKGQVSDGSPNGVLSQNDGKIFKHNDIEPKEYAQLFYDLLPTQAHCYTMTNNIGMLDMMLAFRDAGFEFHNALYHDSHNDNGYIWEKGNKTPSQYYMPDHERIFFYRKGPAFPINNPSTPSILKYPNPRSKNHPTEKPVELMKVLITNSSQIDQVVFDPFMGGGSTSIAAIESGRKFIGCEIDEDIISPAIERIKAANVWVDKRVVSSQIPLFAGMVEGN